MDGKQKTRVLFVRYDPGRSSPYSSNGEMSQQRHAAQPDQAAPPTRSTSKAIVPRSGRWQTPAPSLKKQLGGLRMDPFNSYTVKDLSPHAHQMLDYSLTYQWPIFSFANPGATVEDMKRHLMGRIMFSATSFYVVVFVGATHWAISQYGRDVPKENAMLRLSFKHAALKQLAAEVENAGQNMPAQTLYNMMALAAYGRAGEKLKPPPYEPNQSILATANQLLFHSRMPIEWAHLRAMFHLIKERGGLPMIARPGFALVTSMYDIMISCQRLAEPTFPLLQSTESLLSTWPQVESRTGLSAYLGSGFSGLSNEPNYVRLHAVIDHVVQLTLGYDRYERSRPDAPLLFHILHARSTVLHDLLSLPDSVGDGVGPPDSIIYEISRLGSIAYLLVSLYPISPGNGPHEDIAQRIQGLLKHASQSGMWQTHLSLLVWAVVLGGIMAKALDIRPWYVEYLTSSGLKDLFPDWASVSTIMNGFLWHKSGCEDEGKKLWGE
ncbi:hypothetical protein DV738_g2734, partial [Chaetothyriales sp. CBS 135597]